MIFRRRRRKLVCIDFVEIVTDYLEDAMAPDDRARFEEHMAACGGCARYFDQLRTTIEVAGRLTVDDVDALGAEGRDELLSAFRAYHAGG